MSNYHLTENAENEMDEIWIYLYNVAGELIANRQVARLRDSFRLLARHTSMGVVRNEYGLGIRRHNVPDTPYFVLYRLATDGIEIVRIRHGSRGAEGLGE